MEPQQQAIEVSIKAGRLTLKAVVGALRALIASRGKIKHGEQSIRRLNLQNRQLESMEVPGEDIKAFRRELNKYSVDFSVYKDKETGAYSVFFKGQDIDRVHYGIENALKDFDKLHHDKKPVKEVMEDAVKRAAEREAGRGGQQKEHSAEKGSERE